MLTEIARFKNADTPECREKRLAGRFRRCDFSSSKTECGLIKRGLLGNQVAPQIARSRYISYLHRWAHVSFAKGDIMVIESLPVA